MENIDLFDRYINDELSDKERREFEARLKNDNDLATDFKIYSMTVVGICREAEQDNKDFEIALRKISKDKLKKIIGCQTNEEIVAVDDVDSNLRAADISPVITLPAYQRPWIWQVASIALLILASTWVLVTNHNASNRVDNAICASTYMMFQRSGIDVINIDCLTDKELKEKLPILEADYRNSTSLNDIADHGFVLALTYIRLHDRRQAKSLLVELINLYAQNEDYAGYVNQWKTILSLIE